MLNLIVFFSLPFVSSGSPDALSDSSSPSSFLSDSGIRID